MTDSRIVLVSGAGSGLGRALAIQFASEGHRVVGLGRSQAKLEETGAGLGDQFVALTADISDFAQFKRAVDHVVGKYGRIDVLINNAALYPKIDFFAESPEEWSATLGANLNGVAFGCKLVLPLMIKQGYGRVLNVGSWAHLGPIPESAAYSTSKGAVHVLTKSIAQDMSATEGDIGVYEWIPGHLNTQMSDYTGMDPAQAAKWAPEIVAAPSPASHYAVYEQNRLWEVPVSRLGKIKRQLQFWR